MEDINISEQKWKYIDKQFCGEVAALENKDTNGDGIADFVENAGAYENLAKLVERKEQMKKDICRPECPKDFKDCKCYKSESLTPDKTNDVFCAMVKDGFAFACPETCCNEGAGCPEPGRTEADNDAPEVPEGAEEVSIEEVQEATSDKKGPFKNLTPGQWTGIAVGLFISIICIIIVYRYRKRIMELFGKKRLKETQLLNIRYGGNSD